MRFIENGPDIPDDLLFARDKGRVVFFCGAGVSRARACLPDFFGLAESVSRALRISEQHAAALLIREAGTIEDRTGVSGVIPADRIFGLLERDFDKADIEEAVATALKPTEGVDVSAHKALLDLATDRLGQARLVTTNFDRLFEKCGADVAVHEPPRLPDPNRESEFQGVIYLHGRANENYNGASGDGFVLSSSAFGHAYLAEGWATRFFKEVVKGHTVVFIGYSADDPPVGYLLEGLNMSAENLNGIYAFQEGPEDLAKSHWDQKGVRAIAYEAGNEHAALWDTIKAWAVRARDTNAWIDGVRKLGLQGPCDLEPYQRGQIAHLLKSEDGARVLLSHDDPLPTSWLAVLDPAIRYSRPANTLGKDGNTTQLDPFEFLALDNDIRLELVDLNRSSPLREMPKNAWDGFAANQWDRIAGNRNGQAIFCGSYANTPPPLTRRQVIIANWIASQCNRASTVWWACKQQGLHSEIRGRINWQLGRGGFECSDDFYNIWQYLFRIWSNKADEDDRKAYALKSKTEKYGWSLHALRKFEDLSAPYLVSASMLDDIKLPPNNDGLKRHELLRLDVKYPYVDDMPKVPESLFAEYVSGLRRNLECAIRLEKEIGHYGWRGIPSFYPSEDAGTASNVMGDSLDGWVLRYARQFEQLAEIDAAAAAREASMWDKADDHVFAHLRIWLGKFDQVISPAAYVEIVTSLAHDVFWDDYCQRDILLTLKTRWIDFNDVDRQAIEERILEGPHKWEGIDDENYKNKRAYWILMRIKWLQANGCSISSDVSETIERLEAIIGGWNEEKTANAIRSWDAQVGYISNDTTHDRLMECSISEIIKIAEEDTGHYKGLTETKPFLGLIENHPRRALLALLNSARQEYYPEWAWQEFLNKSDSEAMSPRMIAFLASYISHMPKPALQALIYPVCDWLLRHSEDMDEACLPYYNGLFGACLHIIKKAPNIAGSRIRSNNPEDRWANSALNSVVGILAESLFNDPRTDAPESGDGLPQSWKEKAERLLKSGGDLGRHALVFFARDLAWLHHRDPVWTEQTILPFLDRSSEDKDAWWEGYLWGVKSLMKRDLFEVVKPHFLDRAKVLSGKNSAGLNQMADLMLASWASPYEDTKAPRITDAEFRDVLLHAGEPFRKQVVWSLSRRMKHDDNGGNWGDIAHQLFTDVWPKERRVKSAEMSSSLLNMLFASKDAFLRLLKAVRPHLKKINRQARGFHAGGDAKKVIINNHPDEVAALLLEALPSDAENLSYDIEWVIDQLAEVFKNENRDNEAYTKLQNLRASTG